MARRFAPIAAWIVALLAIVSCGNAALPVGEPADHRPGIVASPEAHPEPPGKETVREASPEPEETALPDGTRANGTHGGKAPAEEAVDRERDAVPKKGGLPDGFVYLDEAVPGALFDIRYFTDDNFVGEKIDGYKAPVPIASKAAAKALKRVNDELAQDGYVLLIYDAYRPQKAVEHFIRWAADPEDTKMKETYYPEVDKTKVFKLGYVASRSGHSRGSTIDLTIARADTGEPLDMGSPFDFFGDVSGHGTELIGPEQKANRERLKNVMVKYGFNPYNKEWWHYTLKDEPFPKRYFDFDVE
ncbi:M15 family metallopeptidase [Paenibacillaceae bacterium WGS1546]|uniref:M15 family metallopeptidase n=1 Tax=Cohnella sp. WGS1546 TaxID=3366810 RepID=UPI00372CFF0B